MKLLDILVVTHLSAVNNDVVRVDVSNSNSIFLCVFSLLSDKFRAGGHSALMFEAIMLHIYSAKYVL